MPAPSPLLSGSFFAHNGLSVSIQVSAQGANIPLSDRDRNSQLFQILIECLSTEIDLTRHEKVPYVSFEFRCGKTDDPAAHAAQPAITPL